MHLRAHHCSHRLFVRRPQQRVAAARRATVSSMDSPNRKLRVLCLHGFRTSGAFLSQQLHGSGFAAAFDDLLVLEYADAPYRCGPEEEARLPPMMRRFIPGPYHEWWNAVEGVMEVSESYFKPFWNVLQGGRVYLRWEETIDYLRDYLSTHGPFDGLLGFSQGERGLDTVPPLRFCMLFSAQCARSEALEALFAGEPQDLPVVAVLGEHDQEVPPEATEELAATFRSPLLLRCSTPGHKIHKLDDAQREAIRSFLLQRVQLAAPAASL